MKNERVTSASLTLLVLGILFSVCISSTVAAARPNVVVVMTDDQGYPEVSAHGNPVLQTPNLDALHSQSLRLTDFHVAPMCAPTRGQLLTGQDAACNGCINVSSGRALLRPEIPTVANIFGDAGYSTGVFGKWHLGANYPFRPEDRGFHRSVWFPSSHIGSVPDAWGNDYFDDTHVSDGVPKAFKGYCTDIFFDEAMSFMKDSAKSGKPFLSYIATNTPHGPLNPKEEGSTHGPRYFNAGMRGEKTELWDGGHRVPCFISSPEGELASPQDIDGLTQVQDLLPTLVDLCEIEAKAKFSGTSLTPILRGKAKVPEDRTLIINYSRMPNFVNYPTPFAQSIMSRDHAAVLWKRWRLLEDRELYNLKSDPLQKTNVIDQHPDVVRKMRGELYRWWDEVGPTANVPQRVIIGSDQENPSRLTSMFIARNRAEATK